MRSIPICKSIERIARRTYYGPKIEHAPSKQASLFTGGESSF
jgi:hypothetical protein